jgi:hypothetical protein
MTLWGIKAAAQGQVSASNSLAARLGGGRGARPQIGCCSRLMCGRIELPMSDFRRWIFRRPPYLKWIEERFPKPSIPVQFRAGVPIFYQEIPDKKFLALVGDWDNILRKQ